MFLWPSFTPGRVSTSMSRIAARWCSAKLRICAWANLISEIVPGDTRARMDSSSALPSFFGTHLSNCCEYSRTAASPRALTPARMPSTVWRTFASISSVTSRARRRLRWVAMANLRIRALTPNSIAPAPPAPGLAAALGALAAVAGVRLPARGALALRRIRVGKHGDAHGARVLRQRLHGVEHHLAPLQDSVAPREHRIDDGLHHFAALPGLLCHETLLGKNNSPGASVMPRSNKYSLSGRQDVDNPAGE